MNIYPCSRKPGIRLECAAKLLPYISKESVRLLHHISKSIDISASTTRNSKHQNINSKAITHKSHIPLIQKLTNHYRVSYSPSHTKKTPFNSLNLTKNTIDNVDDSTRKIDETLLIKQINEHNSKEFEKINNTILGIKHEMKLISEKIDENQSKVYGKLQIIEKMISNLSLARKPDTILVNIKNNGFSNKMQTAFSSYSGKAPKSNHFPKEQEFRSLNLNKKSDAAAQAFPPIHKMSSRRHQNSMPSSDNIVAAESLDSKVLKNSEEESVKSDDELNKLDQLIYEISHTNSKTTAK